jgi:hypothetical protein
MRVLKWLGIAVFVLITLFVIGGLVGSSHYTFERSIEIAAAPAAIHPYLDDLRQWPAWAPWVDIDPTVETTYGDLSAGVGATEEWHGESGSGRLRITRSDPHSGIAYEIVFFRSEEDEMPARCTMNLYSREGGARVTWTMEGDTGSPILGVYSAKLVAIAFGPMFDAGLAKLKRVVEENSPMLPAPSSIPPGPQADTLSAT